MQEEKGTLEGLREEIDRIDDSLHDLLMRRAEVSRAIDDIKRVDGVKSVKNSTRLASAE